jgi:hypothetical protein
LANLVRVGGVLNAETATVGTPALAKALAMASP